MEITFECGVTVTNVAMPGMAARAHVGQCDNEACQAEAAAFAEANKNVQVDF